ncbi:DUF1801 domain-containing protein [Curvivirga sp.]|uniref:DUF1801 domain-containing protein n=1 Tax=Curvivirga sp. TaxID=2856848 RepID=UPI003B5C08A3
MDQKVQNLLEDIKLNSDEKFQMVEGIRSLFLKSGADFNEAVKYGGLTYSLADDLAGGIFIYKEHISIEFSHGASFLDENKILEGGGKYRRHIKIREMLDLENKLVASFIQQAIKYLN